MSCETSPDVFSSSVCNNCSWKSPRQAWLIRAVLLLWFLLCGSCSDVQTPKNIPFLISTSVLGRGRPQDPRVVPEADVKNNNNSEETTSQTVIQPPPPEGTSLISEGAPSHTWTGPGRVATATVHFPLVLEFNFFFNSYGGPTLTNQKTLLTLFNYVSTEWTSPTRFGTEQILWSGSFLRFVGQVGLTGL